MTDTKTELAYEETDSGRGVRPKIRLLQLALWLVLPILLVLYLLHSVESQSGIVYRIVRGTPIERQALRLLPVLWQHKSFLERQAMNSGLTAQERLTSKQLFKRMERMRPTHAVHLADGQFVFGRPSEKADGYYGIKVFNGNHRTEKKIPIDHIRSVKPLVMGQGTFSPRNIRFLLDNHQLHHYYLDPYLFVTEAPFHDIMELYGILSILEDQFKTHFGPLVNRPEDTIAQVAYFNSRKSLIMAMDGDLMTIPNASAFFHKGTNTLYLYREHESENPSSAHMFESVLLDHPTDRREKKHQLFNIIRHEGAHHLTVSLGLFDGLATPRFWLEEGIAQYCETSPFESPHPEKLLFLHQALTEGKLIPWDTLLTASLDEVNTKNDYGTQLCYAQSWLMFHYFMSQERRPRFLAFLLKLSADGHWQDHHKVALSNALHTTWEKIESDLNQMIKKSQEAPRPSG